MTKPSDTPRQRAERGNPEPFQRPDGRWTVTIELARGEDGQRRRHPIYGQSADDVGEKVKLFRQRLDTNEETFTPQTTVAVWARKWIDSIEPKWDDKGRRTGIKHSSWRGYEKHVRLDIEPMRIGQRRLDQLTTAHIESWIEFLGSDERPLGPLGPRSIAYAHRTLSRALKTAVKKGLIGANPAKDVDLPSQTTEETTIFTLEQARTFLRAIKGHKDEALLLVSVFTAPRQGEELSLMRDKLNLDRGTITYTHTLDWIKGKPVIEENKTRGSRRTVLLPPYVIGALRQHLERQEQRRIAATAEPRKQRRNWGMSGWTDYGLLFTGEYGQALRGSTVYRRFQRLLEKHNLPRIRFHDLRHSAASIMLALGMPMISVQRTIGHASLKMLSERYGHVVPELAAEHVAMLEQALVTFDADDPGFAGL